MFNFRKISEMSLKKKVFIFLIVLFSLFLFIFFIIKKSYLPPNQFQLGDINSDFVSLDIATKLAKNWHEDAELVTLEITRIPEPEEIKTTLYIFESKSYTDKKYAVTLNLDNSVKDHGEYLLENEESKPSIKIENIKIGSKNAFDICKKKLRESNFKIYKDNFLSLGLFFSEKTNNNQWSCVTSQNGKIEVTGVLINTEIGNIEMFYQYPY